MNTNVHPRVEFHRKLVDVFSTDDLQDLCFELDINYEDIPGEGRSAKARELIGYCERRGRAADLRAYCMRERPHVTWPILSKEPEPKDAADGSRDLVGVRRHEPMKPPTGPIRDRWALLVGINRYTDPAVPTLKYGVADVKALQTALEAMDFTVIAMHDEAEQLHLLPTRDNIEAELARLCRLANSDDLLLAHFSCHGKVLNGKPLLVTSTTRLMTLARSALPLADVEAMMRDSKARRLLLWLDACHVGVEMGREITDPEFLLNVHEHAEGFALLAASTSQQVAYEQEGHGIFTHYLLQGLSGKADRDAKGFVTIDDLKGYVLNALRKWNATKGVLQEPTARSEGIGDMIVGKYPAASTTL